MRILQVSKADIGGGAEKVAWDLLKCYKQQGLVSWLAVGRKISSDGNVFVVPNRKFQRGWSRFWKNKQLYFESQDGRLRSAWRFSRWARFLASPSRWIEEYRGVEDFRFPGSWHLLDIPPNKPDLVHCHNLHNDYFDLNVLPWLSNKVPVVLTLHDAWLLSGHCAHSFECDRWQSGCGECPDLTIYPAIKRDSTGYNWRRKQNIFSRSRLYVASPCKWLMEKVEKSMLAPAIVGSKVIPYGIDLSIFRPGNKDKVRARLDVPQKAKVLLFAATGVKRNAFKDYETLRKAVEIATAYCRDKQILLIALGESASTEKIGNAEVRFVQFQKDPNIVASHYQVADVYVHAARVDTFPNAVLEALACATPVVATAVGGIPEQVKGLRDDGVTTSAFNRYDATAATGMLTTVNNPAEMARCIEKLLNNSELSIRLGENAAMDAKIRFNLQRQVDDYLKWYEEILHENAFSSLKISGV